MPASAPSARIPEHGRLTLDAASLSAVDVAVLELALPPEAKGSEPLTAVVVSVDGRRIETRAMPLAGDAGGVRLELDPAWLRPGRYMIHVTTAEQTPLHFRRYVLDVQ